MELFPPLPVTVQDVPTPVITPRHSPNPSHGSAGFRTPIHTLTLHEYRKQQYSPSPNSTVSTGRTLRRKPAALLLNSLERIPSRSSTPATGLSSTSYPSQTPPPTRPSITLARDLSSIFDQYAALGVDPHLTREDLLSLSSLRASSESAPSLKSSFSFQHLDKRASSAPIHDEIESVYRAYDSPRRPSTAFKPIKKLPHPRGIRTVSSNGSFVKYSQNFRLRPPTSSPQLDDSSSSNISLSKFPPPPLQSLPLTSVAAKTDENAPLLRPTVSTATITPPATPTVLHYRGASFDLLNPHRSLDLHAIETPEPDKDLVDYPFPRSSGHLVAMGEEDPRNRRIFETLPSAHKAITKKAKFVLPKGRPVEERHDAFLQHDVPQIASSGGYVRAQDSPLNETDSPLRQAIDRIFPYLTDATDSAKDSPHSTHDLTPTNFGFPHGQGFSYTAERYPSSMYSQDDELPQVVSSHEEDTRETKPDRSVQGLEVPEDLMPRSATSPGCIPGDAREGVDRSSSVASSKHKVLLKRNHLEFDMMTPPAPKRDVAAMPSESSSSDDVRRAGPHLTGIVPISGSDTNASSYEATTKRLELTPKTKKWSRRKRSSLKKSNRKRQHSPFFPNVPASEILADLRPSESSDWKTVYNANEPEENAPVPPYERTWQMLDTDDSGNVPSVTRTHKPNDSSLANLSSRYDSTDNLISPPKKGYSKPPVSRAYNRTSGSSIANVSSTGSSADFGRPAETAAHLFPEPSETPFGHSNVLPSADIVRAVGEEGESTSPKNNYVQALRSSLLPPELKSPSPFDKDIALSPLSPISDHSPTTPEHTTVHKRDSGIPQDTRYVPYFPGAISPDPYRAVSKEVYELDALHDNGPGPSLVDQTFYDIPLDDDPPDSHSQPEQSRSLKDLESQVARPAAALLKKPLSEQRYPLKSNRVSFAPRSPQQISAPASPATADFPQIPRLFTKYHRQQIFATRANIDRGNYPLTPDEQLDAILRLRRAQLEYPDERQAVRLVTIFCLLAAPVPPVFALLVATGCVSTFLGWCSDGKITKMPPKARRVLVWATVLEVVGCVALGAGLGVYFGVFA